MDRVEEIIFKFNSERKQTPEEKKMNGVAITLAIIALFIFGAMMIWQDYSIVLICGVVIMFIIALLLIFLVCWYTGKLGTQKRKNRMIMLKRKRFMEEQARLINVIKENEMTPQQVYNTLCKKYNRIPPTDTKVYIISISSIVLTLANIFIQPLNKIGFESYDQYVLMVFLFIVLSGELAYIVVLFISIFFNSNSDEKLKAKNKYIFKLLEDYVS